MQVFINSITHTLKLTAMSVIIIVICFFAWLGQALNDGGKV